MLIKRLHSPLLLSQLAVFDMDETICKETQKFIEENLSIKPNYDLIDRGMYKELKYKSEFEDMPIKQPITEITFTLNRDVVGHPVTIEMFREGDTIPKGSIIIDVSGSEIICLVPYSIIHNPHKGQAYNEDDGVRGQASNIMVECDATKCKFNSSKVCLNMNPRLEKKESDLPCVHAGFECYSYKE